MKPCQNCGMPVYNAKRKYCCDACRKEAEKTRSWERSKWREHVKNSQKSLDEKIQRASELNMSYGKYVAMLYLEKIRSENVRED